MWPSIIISWEACIFMTITAKACGVLTVFRDRPWSTCVISLNLFNSLNWWLLKWSPIHRWGNWGKGGLGSLPRVTHYVGRGRTPSPRLSPGRSSPLCRAAGWPSSECVAPGQSRLAFCEHLSSGSCWPWASAPSQHLVPHAQSATCAPQHQATSS